MNNHLAQSPITPNQEGKIVMWDEVLWSVGAQKLDTSGYQVSDPEDIEFHSDNHELNMDAIFRRSINTPFSSSFFNEDEMGSMAENPILIDKEQDKENSPHLPTSPVSERPTQPPVLMRKCP